MSVARALRSSLLTVATALAGCSDQDVSSGNPTQTAVTTSTSTSTSTSTATGTGGAGGAAATGSGGGAGGSTALGAADVTVVHGADTATVDLTKLTTQDYKGTLVVPLQAVWAAGGLAAGQTRLEFDFEGDDGFHPSQKSKCAAYITYAEIAQGYLIPETRSLVWDDALGLPGCYSVKAVAKVTALDVP